VLVDRLVREEKLRWAYEIHDGLTQTVTAAVIELERMADTIQRDPAEASAEVVGLASAMRDSLADVRRVLFELSDVMADSASPGFRDTISEAEERWGLRVNLTVEGDPARASDGMRLVSNLVLREALANVAKHAATSAADVHVRVDDHHIEMDVRDDGRGIEPGDAGDDHFGMRMMRRRVADAGGSLEVVSAPGHGARLLARLPLHETGRQHR